ncbi:MAG: hypothetical protein HOI47_32385 [Candidatus Scalindua sp.]|nr:hypothetical protein [Candidatus Scalindua sp.]MBT6231365.1 hypothetical protein [Candidatus Scalindua sp.]MBT7210952.1 hypothetical protein [Candidatus Scalindua sp.]MBT7592080.1 hypothetical protein [Candidatus Scalindua sp.]
MKFERRKTDIRGNYEGIDRIEEDRRIQKRNFISRWFIINKNELSFYLLILIVCVVVAVIYSFSGSSTSNLDPENRNYVSASFEKYEDLEQRREQTEKK